MTYLRISLSDLGAEQMSRDILEISYPFKYLALFVLFLRGIFCRSFSIEILFRFVRFNSFIYVIDFSRSSAILFAAFDLT